MSQFVKLKQLILALGDIFIFYSSLFLTLYLRYGRPLPAIVFDNHLEPFTYLFAIWLVIFYIVGLYEIKNLKNNVEFLKKISAALSISAVITIAAFYFIPSVIAPKVNLFLIIAFIFILDYLWRRSYNRFLSAKAPATRVLLIGSGPTTKEIASHLRQNPQLGYEIKELMEENLTETELETVREKILAKKINLLVIPNHLKKNSQAARAIYKNLTLGIDTIDFASFYELVYNKIPVTELEEVWFIENLLNRHKIYESLKRPIEIIFASLLFIITLPLSILTTLLIKITSPGAAIIKQTRVGQHHQPFTLYKFRTMVTNAEQHGAQWSAPNDQRVTSFGKILRHSHLDELPQLINIIKGDLSFVGPRPERPEFTEKLKEVLPHYEIRHLIRPGITGWAQLNYRYGSSVADSLEKLQYDIYYLKNRSFWLDLSIIVKTLKLFFIRVI